MESSLVLSALTEGKENKMYFVEDKFSNHISLLANENEIIVVSLYARVSSTKEEQLQALERQKSKLSSWLDYQCSTHKNWRKGKIYVDTKTGRNFNRNAYQEMMKDAKKGQMNYIIFCETSRFGRNLSAVLKECIKLNDDYGVDLYFLDKDIDTRSSDGLGKLAEQAKYADEYSQQTRYRVMRGINEKRRQLEEENDGYLFTHRVLGLESRKGIAQHLFRVEEEVETLNMMAYKYLECKSLGKTATYLMEQGRRTVSGEIYWDATSVSKALHNSIYVCIEEQDKTKSLTIENYYNASRTRIPKEQRTYAYMPNRIERIWDDKLYLAIQEQLKSNAKRSEFRKSVDSEVSYGYKGLLWCECGGGMNIHNRNEESGKKYYECHNKKHRGSKQAVELAGRDPSEICNSSVVYEWKLNLMFQTILQNIGVSKESILKEAEQVLQDCMNSDFSKEAITEKIEALNAEIGKLQKKISNHRSRLVREIITEEEYLEDIRPLQKEIENLKEESSILERSIKVKSSQKSKNNIIEKYVSSMDNLISNAENEFIYQMVDFIVKKGDNEFIWYLRLEDVDIEAEIEIPKQYQVKHKMRLPLKVVEVVKDSRRKLMEFTISEFSARAFKKKEGLAPLKKYEELKVSVYY